MIKHTVNFFLLQKRKVTCVIMMKKSELRQIVREMIQEEIGTVTTEQDQTQLQEKLEGPGYMIKAWADPEQKSGTPTFDSAKVNVIYPDFDAVLEALKLSDLSELGAYEITWVKSGTEVEE